MTLKSISIELVPRDWGALLTQCEAISNGFPQIGVVNIPDLLRFEIRSWDACARAKKYFPRAVPHLRAVDFNLRERFSLAEKLAQLSIESVVVVSGDPPQDMSTRVYRNTSLELIRVLKKEAPGLRIYAGIDPYRDSLQAELDYAHAKIDAGADGFFTQPFFDVRLLEIYIDQLHGHDVFWGISPVTTEQSKAYWESRNSVVFPRSFRAELDWNISLAKHIVEVIKEANGNVYFMPIRVDPVAYLRQVL